MKLPTGSDPTYSDGYVWSKRGVYDSSAKATRAEVENARKIVRAAGVERMATEWERLDREAENKGPGGRKPFIGYEEIVTIMLLLATLQASQTIRAATALILHGLDETSRQDLGIKIGNRDRESIYYATRRSYHRLLNLMDPHPGPRRKRLDIATFDALEKRVDPELRRIRHERLNTLNNGLLIGTWTALPRNVRRRYKGNIAVDGTFIPAFGRFGTSRKRDKHMGIEPHAGWWGRDGNHFVHEDKTAHLSKAERAERGKYRYGWEATLAVACSNDPKRQSTFPQLVLGIALDTPGVTRQERNRSRQTHL